MAQGADSNVASDAATNAGNHGEGEGNPLGGLARLYRALPMLLVCLASLQWASRPSVPVLVRGMGLMSPPDVRRGFYARSAGQVQSIEVRVGETVRRGQRLATLNRIDQNAPGGGGSAASGPQVIGARLQAVRQQMQVLGVQARAFDDQQRALEVRRRQIETTNQPVTSQLNALEELRRDEVIARYSPLWVGAQDLVLRNKADISSVDAALAQLRAQRAALRAQAAELSAQRAALESEEFSQEVFSAVDGQVLDVSVLPGQPVAPGQKLGSIGLAPSQEGKLAVVLFTAADATRLEVGDEVKLIPQLLSRDSFGSAEQRYGLVPGRVVSLSQESVDLAEVTSAVGSQEEAANLMASARQKSFGDGGDLTAQLPGRTGAPLVLAVVRLEEAATPSGLAWSRGDGPRRPLPQRTPAEVEAELEMRAPLSYLLPFWRWIAGSRA
jgi:multidrug efflux pump subunit AcrA (membrane-fusion protein)